MRVNWRGTDNQASQALKTGRIDDVLVWIHFIKPVYVIEPFAFGRAGTLVLVAAAIGYVTGIAFAMLWNRVHR